MKKRKSLIVGIVILIMMAYCVYYMFYSNVYFEYVYDGIVTFSDMDTEYYKEFIKKNANIYNSKEEWENIEENFGLISSGQIPDISFGNESILLIHLPLSIEKGGILYSIETIRKNLFDIKITLEQKGTVSDLKGFEENARTESIIIYKIKLGMFSEIYKPYII